MQLQFLHANTLQSQSIHMEVCRNAKLNIQVAHQVQSRTASRQFWICCRSFGCAAPVGTVYSINPAMIMTLVPLVGAAATHYSHFDMIHYGSYVSALSPVWMALFSTGKFAVFVLTKCQLATTWQSA